ncbi:MAG: ABC transporter ATP-binding protein [Deltaproteobacteria bacterium]|jgi:branched-chain amino acid transport system ATP-binding protein|nr:ABC transporter ATP-binding protein [Deltaproteobacteria bacterium]MBT4644648.1 ABC transporter ATP-binding protein [Deltaproteobacteria bacterium]
MLLEVKDLNTYYGPIHSLRDMSLNVEAGETVALLGRNGMGKSTTMKSILGLAKPRSGTVLFKGQSIFGNPPFKTARAGIGYVPEERRIFKNLSVLDNLELGIKGKETREIKKENRWTHERVYKHFPILKERSSQKASLMSGGEQQMLAIARALMGNPDLILVDEPTEGLSPVMVNEVRDVLADVAKTGVAILFVEHNLKVAMYLADRLYLMGKAHLGFTGTPAELEANPQIREEFLEV